MKHTMIKKCIWSALGAIILVACSNETLENIQPFTKEKKEITIQATSGNTNTRTTYTDPGSGSAITVEWAPNDQFMLYKGDGYAEVFTYQGSGSAATGNFSGTLPSSTSGSGNYNAFYPAMSAGQAWESCLVTTAGQVQPANGSIDHLNKYDYMTATNVTETAGEWSAAFNHLMSIMTFNITLPHDDATAGAVQSLTLSTDADEFYVSMKADGTGKVTAKSVTLKFENTHIDASSNLKANLVFIPTTLNAKELRVNVVCELKTYNFSVTTSVNKTYEAGKRYTFTLGSGQLTDITTNNVLNSSTIPSAFSGGDGTEGTPYLISTPGELSTLINAPIYWDQNFKLTTDIHIDLTAWACIGTESAPFEGTFDGDGHTISGNLIGTNGVKHTGFFGYTSSVTIKNLHMATNMTTAASYGVSYSGILIGHAENTIVQGCTSSGTITIYSVGDMMVGGLIGESNGSTVTDCTSTSIFTLPYPSLNGAYSCIGGLIGISNGNTVVNKSLFKGSISLTNNQPSVVYIAGIVGYSPTDEVAISQCRNEGNISNESFITYTGGVLGAGKAAITDCQNNGDIYGHGTLSSINPGQAYVGGLIGALQSGSMHTSINSGAVTGEAELFNDDIMGYIPSTLQKGSLVGDLLGGAVYDSCKNYGTPATPPIGSGQSPTPEPV